MTLSGVLSVIGVTAVVANALFPLVAGKDSENMAMARIQSFDADYDSMLADLQLKQLQMEEQHRGRFRDRVRRLWHGGEATFEVGGESPPMSVAYFGARGIMEPGIVMAGQAQQLYNVPQSPKKRR